MPTLHWIGKDKVVSHHQDVPYRVLEHKYGFAAGKGEQSVPTNSGNKIIHGDNLEALKSLLPEYEGKIKCIYIDPPYNTGNESWVYNDNVNHPKIKKWLGEVVGKDGEDLTRHDKWLCMMYPRLKLLHKLLADDGAIFISIDDNEQANLKLICDEIFGSNNFVSNIIWRSSDNSNNDSKQFSVDYNHTLVFSKRRNWLSNKLLRNAQQSSHYKNPDNDPRGPYFDGNPISSPNYRENLCYDLVTPDGKIIKHPKNGWRWSKESLEYKLNTGEIRFNESYTNIKRRTYLNEQKGLPPSNLWIDLEETGHNRNAKYDLVKIFEESSSKNVFQTPKPSKFIDKIIKVCCGKSDIILDSFAGSGTTAHAVLNLNKQDGGNRKFILVEMEDYANEITAERVKRVAKGYGTGAKAVAGTGGAFDFYELGLPLFDENQNLNEKVGLTKIKEYIWFSETRTSFSERLNAEVQSSQSINEDYKLGVKDGTVYYFIYEKDKLTTLDFDALELIKTKGEQYVIYADNCLLPKDFMARKNIIFKKIPRDITRF
ncbi:site-specific DNA-methyltransferase [Belliella sp. R4-6]|uniref:site-specific DNA-methyltransferase (adenine-specific) n=1 Tax=Belliella alkalica TaxID=1730871 RepID=A0ABS9V797_9BACT|nr:site-specific DNA-methyltransferase [Belliella alkalica]MCH7412295.1 site-specific DNA-methyltransferase [Belliella alkalica]